MLRRCAWVDVAGGGRLCGLQWRLCRPDAKPQPRACKAGGHTIGITCVVWPRPANPFIAEEVRTQSFPERLMALIERGDAYIALPGGTGTLAELALCWEMMNKGSLSKTVGGMPLLVDSALTGNRLLTVCVRKEN